MRHTIRRARPQDAPELFLLLAEMHAETGIDAMDRGKVLREVVGAIEHGLVLVAERDGRMVGSIGAVYGSFWYSSERRLFDRWTYVAPAQRRSRIVFNLIRAFMREADAPVAVGITTAKDAERKNALFRRFFTPIGEMFIGDR